MKKKVLLTALGTGQKDKNNKPYYREAIYEYNNNYFKTSYISEVFIEDNEYDEIIYLGTKTSGWDNLYEYYFNKLSEDNQNDDLTAIYFELNDKVLDGTLTEEYLYQNISPLIEKYYSKLYKKKMSIYFALMDMGIDDKELDNNLSFFMNLAKKHLLNQEKIIDLDITHSFRSLPIFYYTMIQYLSVLDRDRKLEIGSMYYGMFETSKDVYGLKESLLPDNPQIKLNKEAYKLIDLAMGEDTFRPAKIVNLSNILDINGWIQATYEFTNYGYAGNLSIMLEQYANILPNKESKEFIKLSEQIKRISFKLNTNEINNIYQDLNDMSNTLKNIKNMREQKPFILATIDLLDTFTKNLLASNKGILVYLDNNFNHKYKLQYSVAMWYLDHSSYISFVTTLYESLISFLVVINKLGSDSIDNFEKRGTVKKQYQDFDCIGTLKDYKEYRDLSIEIKISIFINTLGKLRNDMAHVYSTKNHSSSYSKYTNNVNILFKKNPKETNIYEEILSEYNKIIKESVI